MPTIKVTCPDCKEEFEVDTDSYGENGEVCVSVEGSPETVADTLKRVINELETK